MIPSTVLTTEKLLVSYYIKGIPTSISMWFKRTHNPTLQGAFVEAILLEKDMFGLKDNPDLESDQPSPSRRRKDNAPKPIPKNRDSYDMDNMKNYSKIFLMTW